ncbi:hypothetical protein [Aurantiacibacter poecillastricola]|uniref:hypothetical protein n=1 Tax=Aurantiacibacter poecillastricola TaxID=3064385 RepID=UPI00273D18B8|nr:hypothetical protein [Aurantiacibacter sp. 219JJ12-13]MDP5260806.1 hypothetical protein [Aurantiacibacter sp. 219JJ12-13]
MLKNLFISTAVAAMALAAPAYAQDREERAELAFAELVEGRTAGEPQPCITAFQSSDIRVEENVGLVYERGDTIWVARANNPRSLDNWDVPIIERFGSRLCRYDVTRTIDRSTGMFSGVLFLDDFVPYTRADEAEG